MWGSRRAAVAVPDCRLGTPSEAPLVAPTFAAARANRQMPDFVRIAGDDVQPHIILATVLYLSISPSRRMTLSSSRRPRGNGFTAPDTTSLRR